MIDISKTDKAKVLVALYNNASSQGLGILHYTLKEMTIAEAQELLKEQTYFDYLNGRVMKVDLKGNELNTTFYDRDNGQGAAELALKGIIE